MRFIAAILFITTFSVARAQERSTLDTVYSLNESKTSFQANIQNNSNDNIVCSKITAYLYSKVNGNCQPITGQKIVLKNVEIKSGENLTLTNLGEKEISKLKNGSKNLCQKLFFDYNCKAQD